MKTTFNEFFVNDLQTISPDMLNDIQEVREEHFRMIMWHSMGHQSQNKWYKIPKSDIKFIKKTLRQNPKCEKFHTFIWQTGLYRNICQTKEVYYNFVSYMVRTFGTTLDKDITLYRGVTLNSENISNIGCSWTPNIKSAMFFSGNFIDSAILKVTIPKGTKVYRVNDCKELKNTVLQAKYYNDDEYIITFDILSNLSIRTVQMNDELGQVA